MPLYPKVLSDIARACEQYRQKTITEEQLQQCLWHGIDAIVAVEESDLRAYLQQAEAQIELLRFTVDSELIYENVLPLVAEIENRAKK